MNTTWILVCDAARARLFEVRGSDPAWNLLEVMSHPESRSTGSEHVVGDVEKHHFGHALVAKLDQAMRSKRFDRWVLVAPPHFLGIIKKELTSELEKHLTVSVGKDLTHMEAGALAERLQEALLVPADEKGSAREDAKHAH